MLSWTSATSATVGAAAGFAVAGPVGAAAAAALLGGAASGASYGYTLLESDELKAEKASWDEPHDLATLSNAQKECAQLIDSYFREGSSAQLCSREGLRFGLKYYHFFSCTEDSSCTIEFGSGSAQNNVVTVHNDDVGHGAVLVEETFRVTKGVRDRMKRLAGASNFSLALRNSEHIARYIRSGAWISMQMTSCQRGHISSALFNALRCSPRAGLLNRLPDELKVVPIAVQQNFFPEQHPLISYCGTPTVGSVDDEAFNIVVLGPKNSGKSFFINRLFNRHVCTHPPADGDGPQQRDLRMYLGDAMIGNKKRRVRVVDTIGFCDAPLSSREVGEMLKGLRAMNLTCIDKLVVLTSGRLQPEQAAAIEQVLSWLGFYTLPVDNRTPFLFLYNKADLCRNDAEVMNAVAKVATRLKTGDCHAASAGRCCRYNTHFGAAPNAMWNDVCVELDRVAPLLLGQTFLYDHRDKVRIPGDSSCSIM